MKFYFAVADRVRRWSLTTQCTRGECFESPRNSELPPDVVQRRKRPRLAVSEGDYQPRWRSSQALAHSFVRQKITHRLAGVKARDHLSEHRGQADHLDRQFEFGGELNAVGDQQALDW